MKEEFHWTKGETMLAQMRIKKLQKRIKKLQLNQDELIKFLGKELFNAIDGFYEMEGTVGLKTISLYNHLHDKDKLYITNIITDVKLIADLD